MKGFFVLKCRSWIFAAGLLSFLSGAVFLPCFSGGGTTLTAAVVSDVTACSFIVLFWVGVLRQCNPGRPVENSSQAWAPPSENAERERELCKV